jgi:hypothetical protein
MVLVGRRMRIRRKCCNRKPVLRPGKVDYNHHCKRQLLCRHGHVKFDCLSIDPARSASDERLRGHSRRLQHRHPICIQVFELGNRKAKQRQEQRCSRKVILQQELLHSRMMMPRRGPLHSRMMMLPLLEQLLTCRCKVHEVR